MLRIVVVGIVVVFAAAAGYLVYMSQVVNPRVLQELIDEPGGERARRVMAIRLPSGREIPVNYLREGDMVYAGADGRWWKELVGEDGHPVRLLIRGERLAARARAVTDRPDDTRDIFARLRPNALPGFGTLVEIQLEEEAYPDR